MDPIEIFFAYEKTASEERSKKDFELWKQWNEERTPENMRPLLKQFRPLINSKANVYAGKNPNIPPAAIRAEFTNRVIKGFETYDPNRGASIGTYLNWQLLRGKRFIATYGSGMGRIPENRIYKVNQFMSARDELNDTLGREPAATELADFLKWPVKQVTAMQLEVRREVPSSLLQADLLSVKPSRSAEVLRLIQYELAPEERAVMEMLLGLNGQPQKKPGEIARALNMSPSKVSRIKTRIAEKMKVYMV